MEIRLAIAQEYALDVLAELLAQALSDHLNGFLAPALVPDEDELLDTEHTLPMPPCEGRCSQWLEVVDDVLVVKEEVKRQEEQEAGKWVLQLPPS